jgi:tricorn protease-like protein
MSIGIFDDEIGVGDLRHAGSATFDLATGRYTLAGSGRNMWATTDAFHYLWREATGDFTLSADIAFVGAGVDPHRKAGLVVRQSLDARAAYADAVVHGDGLTSLQFRAQHGDITQEVQARASAPTRLTLEKRGDTLRLWVDGAFSGAATILPLSEPFLVGLAVCAHNEDILETATFSQVVFDDAPAIGEPVLFSTLETMTVASTDRRVRHCAPAHFEAPNWLPDGSALLFNQGGRILRLPFPDGGPVEIDTGTAVRCNNDHGVTPDGRTLIVSDQSADDHQSRIYTLPITGGTPKLVTENAPSYWHGISPDGSTLVYCARRDGAFGIFTIPIDGGEETRLTHTTGLDDGPEYSPDGAFIYFNSDRTGQMHLWRMHADGAELVQLTHNARNNWFPHPSPDGRKLAYLSYDAAVTGHPPEHGVELWIADLETGMMSRVARLFGGQGTINVNSWSPDSRQIAFVTYQRIV